MGHLSRACIINGLPTISIDPQILGPDAVEHPCEDEEREYAKEGVFQAWLALPFNPSLYNSF